MSIYEYDEEKHIRQEREDAMEEGMMKGMTKGLQMGLQKGLHKGELLKLTTLVLKKYAKGFTPEETADMLEEDLSLIQKIYSLKQSFPNLTAEELTDKLLSE